LSRVRALLANEAGGGRGHVALLTAAARALGPGVSKVAALGRLTHAAELAGLCDAVVKAPLLARPRPAPWTFALRGSATWGDVLAEIGLADPGKLRRGLAFWRDLIVAQDVALLIADFAPLALRAALGLRSEGWAIRIVSLGTGYTSPPAGLERFPVYLPDHDRVTHAEAQTLDGLNAAGRELGWPDLAALSALYEVDQALAATPDFLDPYRGCRAASDRIAPLVPAARTLGGAGDGVFVYFSTADATDAVLTDALEALPLPRRGFLPRAPAEVVARLTSSGMDLMDRPATADEIAAFARVIVHAAPHGTLCMAALAGVPQVGVPQHLEQLFNARQAEARGLLHLVPHDSPDIAERISAVHSDPDLAARARDVAADLRRAHLPDPIAMLADRLLPEIAAAEADL
jgi:hypothetical protein